MATPVGPAWDSRGLAAAIVQDAADGRVLMLGWMDAEAYAATLETGEVHFHSRSRNRLWRKGETSGNVFRVRRLSLDCDRDAILLEVDPAGPACHRATRSCFDPGAGPGVGPGGPEPASSTVVARELGSGPGFGWLDELWATIEARALERPAGSYTASLLDGGVDAASRKVVEEATEVLIAAKDDAAAEAARVDRTATRSALAGEAADLLYHELIVLAERGIPPALVIEVLQARASRRSETATAPDPEA